MEIVCTNEGLVLKQLDVVFIELLRKIPNMADPGDNAAARSRLYPNPADDTETIEEWREYVKPELRHLFETANETVRHDLEQLGLLKDDDEFQNNLEVPKAHFESWLSSLNQARLALAAKHGFSEKELAANDAPSFEDDRVISLFQIHFYGFLQECLLRELQR